MKPVRVLVFALLLSAVIASGSSAQSALDRIVSHKIDLTTAPKLEPVTEATKVTEIEGQVFVVLKSGVSLKLALVKVAAYPAKYFTAYRQWQRLNIDGLIDRVKPLAEQLDPNTGIVVFSWLIEMQAQRWAALEPAPAKTSTDADGKFKLRVAFEGDYVVTARAQRNGAQGKEEYTWIVPALKITLGEPLFLTNDNLVELN